MAEAVRIIETTGDVAVDLRIDERKNDDLLRTVEAGAVDTLGRFLGWLRLSVQAELLVNLVKYGGRRNHMAHIRLDIVGDDPDAASQGVTCDDPNTKGRSDANASLNVTDAATASCTACDAGA